MKTENNENGLPCLVTITFTLKKDHEVDYMIKRNRCSNTAVLSRDNSNQVSTSELKCSP